MLSKIRKLELKLRLSAILFWFWFVWVEIGREFFESRQGSFTNIFLKALSLGVVIFILDLVFQSDPGEKEVPIIWLFVLFWISGEMAARILLVGAFREPYTTITLVAIGITWFLLAKDVKTFWAHVRSSSEPSTDSDSDSSEQ